MFIFNSRIFEFNSSFIGELPQQVTHLRGYGWDFARLQPDGLPSRPRPEQLQDWINFVKTNNLKIVWTMLASNTFPIQEEIDYLQYIIDQGVEVTHIQLGGEYWQGRYFYGNTSDPKVIEKITIDDYVEILDNVIPVLDEQLPDVKLMVLGCSHDYTPEEIDAVITQFDLDGRQLTKIKQASDYTVIWNDTMATYIEDSAYDLGITFHYYAGAKPAFQPDNGEEKILFGINWEPFINQIKHRIRGIEMIVPESGWYSEIQGTGKSDKDLRKMSEFIEAGQRALGENGIMGIHVLNQPSETYHNLFSNNGITQVGTYLKGYFDGLLINPTEPVLENVYPDKKGQWTFWGNTYLTFTDGSKYKITTRFSTRPIGSEDYGKTKSEIQQMLE